MAATVATKAMCRPSDTSDSSSKSQRDDSSDGDGGRLSTSSSSSYPKTEVPLVFLVCVLAVAVAASFLCGYYYQTSTNSNISYHGGKSLSGGLLLLLGGNGVSDSMTLSTTEDFGDDYLSPSRRNMPGFILLDTEAHGWNSTQEVSADEDDSDVNEVDDDEEEEDDDDNIVFALAGQIMIDFNRIQSEHINTEDKLFQVMTNVINSLMFELQSYYCHHHEAQPARTTATASKRSAAIPVSPPPARGFDTPIQCVGILTDGDGHVSFYAWPDKRNGGKVFMDLFVTELEDDGNDDEDAAPSRPVGKTKHMLPELAWLESKIDEVFDAIRVSPTSQDDIHDFVLKNVLKQLPHSTDSALRIRGKLDMGQVKNTDIEAESAVIGAHQTVVRFLCVFYRSSLSGFTCTCTFRQRNTHVPLARPSLLVSLNKIKL